MKNTRFTAAALATTGLLCASAAQAGIQVGDGTTASAAAGTPVTELVLLMWDPVAKVTYSKDLGIQAYATSYAAGDTSKNLFVYGQQDAGFQLLLPALNQDANFRAFLGSSTNVANQLWAVVGADINQDAGGVGTEAFTLFTTLNSGNQPNGERNPAYTNFTGRDAAGNHNPRAFNNSELGEAVQNLGAYLNVNLNQANDFKNLTNTHQCDLFVGKCSTADASITNGSSFDTETSKGYISWFMGGGLLSSVNGDILNKVGKSSWFYRAFNSSEVSDEAVTVDEFDNLSHDAYWGLGVDASGNYILSYTLEAHLAQAQTAAGSLLRLRTDFAAHYGSTRLISVPGDSLDLGGAVTAVPEPATWGLMGLGLAVLFSRARYRRLEQTIGMANSPT